MKEIFFDWLSLTFVDDTLSHAIENWFQINMLWLKFRLKSHKCDSHLMGWQQQPEWKIDEILGES